MISILKTTAEDAQLVANIGRVSYIESHGSSAATGNINKYVNGKFNRNILKEELSNPENIYHLIYYGNQPTGYSKIILNCPNLSVQIKHVTKLERLYLLKEFYSLKLGLELLQFNVELSKNSSQLGLWLFVWKENQRAVSFYKKMGFEIIGDYDFKLTESRSISNYLMFLKY